MLTTVDVHAMMAIWKESAQTLPDKIQDPDAHFIVFLKKADSGY